MDIYMYKAEDVFNTIDNCIYAILSDADELLFAIEENEENEGYIASNAMGYGYWECKTIKDCINVIELSYGDKVISKINK